MRIEEIYLDKTLFMETEKNLYVTALDIKDRITRTFKADERKSEYETDGPRHRVDIVLVGYEFLDKFSRIKISFNIYGEAAEKGLLNVEIVGSLVTKIDVGDGLVSQAFLFFYMEKIIPMMKSAAIRKIDDVFMKIEREVKMAEAQKI